MNSARLRLAARSLRSLASALPDWTKVAWEALAPRAAGGAGRARVVQAVVHGAEGVLLSERRELRGWELPGGTVGEGEADEDALRRELQEETGLEVAVGRLVGEYVRTGFRAHVARVYVCRATGGTLRPSREAPRHGWFAPDALPDGIFPWFRGPLDDALRELPAPVARREHQGLTAILAGMRIDLATRRRDP